MKLIEKLKGAHEHQFVAYKNAWARTVNNTQFLSGLDNDYNGFYTANAMTYIAIGY